MIQDENNKIELNKITNHDVSFLYNLLENRDSIYNISHKKMPSFAEHEKFVFSEPYLNWYVISLDTKKIGAAYLSFDDEIGISFLPEYDNELFRKKSLVELINKNPRTKYFANVNPKNEKYKTFLKKYGFELFLNYDKNEDCPQDVFELKKSENKNDYS